MKTKNSIINAVGSMASNLITIIIGLVAQAIFIRILGAEYLGINGLFTNVISMLGIVELGIGSAIIYNLYKPIVNKDKEAIKSLMLFYKKAYNIIAFIVLVIGLLITPFLNLFISDVTVDINIYLVYILFVIDIFASYLLSYKRSILYADQKNYIVNIIHIAYLLLLNLLQLLFLYLTHDYYLYLIIKIVMRVVENIIITLVVNKIYNYLNKGDAKPLSKDVKQDIQKKVKALFFHKIGTFVVMGTDNIIISKFIGIVTVGIYSNYYMIINAVNTIFGQAIIALTPSVGNLLVEGDATKNYDVFKKVRFLNFWISVFSGVTLLVVLQSFIKIWVGEKYLLSLFVLIILVINFFQKMMRSSYSTFKEAAGIFHEDRFVPLVESAVNIVASIVLLKIFGLAGVFMGTIISGFSLWCYSYPKYVYKKLFNRSYLSYIKETLGYILLFLVILFITFKITILITISNIYLDFLVNIGISVIIPNLILFVIFFKTDNFKYYLNLLKKIRGR